MPRLTALRRGAVALAGGDRGGLRARGAPRSAGPGVAGVRRALRLDEEHLSSPHRPRGSSTPRATTKSVALLEAARRGRAGGS